MNSNESQELQATAQGLKLLQRIMTNPKLAELLARYDSEVEAGMGIYEAELLVTELTQEIGKGLMEEWTEVTQDQAVEEAARSKAAAKNGKKKRYYYTSFGKIEFDAQVTKDPATGKTFLPFFQRMNLRSCGCSLLLRRRVIDFSSERSFQKTAAAIKEHYGVEISPSSIRNMTFETGSEAHKFNAELPVPPPNAEVLIAQIDGSMIPTVEYRETEQGKKQRMCSWKEIRLCCVTDPKSETTRYGVTQGTPLQAGCMMYQTSQQQGLGVDTHIHGVADGAPWIADQYEVQFGANHTFLLDFYHAAEYLAEVAREDIEIGHKAWLERKKAQLKEGYSDQVIEDLKLLSLVKGDDSASAKAHQYFSNRSDHLRYNEALENNLPIGSGEVESGHRSVLQARLKKPGAWWMTENAEKVAQLKVIQANGDWSEFWKKQAA